MDKPTEKKEKVIITPRPPRSSFEQWIPVEPVAPEVPDEAPAGGFKKAYLTLNKSGKVVLTYTLWSDQVKKGNTNLCFFWASWSDEAREEAVKKAVGQ